MFYLAFQPLPHMGWCVDSIQVIYGINDQTLKEMDSKFSFILLPNIY